MSNTSLVLTPIDGEPRIHDLHLAEQLGFERPRKIRELIKRNHDKLLKFGGCPAMERLVEGNLANEYYLNQKQSVWVCMKSETEKAFDVQVEIVRVFDAYLNGELRPVLPQSYAQALRLYADQVELCEKQKQELEVAQPKIAFHDQVVSTDALMDFTAAFSLLQRKTGQQFNWGAFIEFGRRHGFACKQNVHKNIGKNRFVPRIKYIGGWFVAELNATSGQSEWMVRPAGIAGIVDLIEQDRRNFKKNFYQQQEAA